jgi:FixJ family two-component response regulator
MPAFRYDFFTEPRMHGPNETHSTSGDGRIHSARGLRAVDPDPPGDAVFIVNGDSRMRHALYALLTSSSIRVQCFESAGTLLAYAGAETCGCLLLDMQLSDISSLGLQRQLEQIARPPIIFINAPNDIPSAFRAMRAGAIAILANPLDPDTLMSAVRTALDHASRTRQRTAKLARLRQRYCSLTRREKEVLSLVVEGLLNKQAAAVLGIALATVQLHRAQIMRKMEARSFAELVRMTMVLRIPLRASISERSHVSSANGEPPSLSAELNGRMQDNPSQLLLEN